MGPHRKTWLFVVPWALGPGPVALVGTPRGLTLPVARRARMKRLDPAKLLLQRRFVHTAGVRGLRRRRNHECRARSRRCSRTRGPSTPSRCSTRKIVKNEVQRAISADEDAIAKLAGNYIDNIKAFTPKERVKNKYTGQDEDPDVRLMRSIEEKIEIAENRKDESR